MTVKEEVYDTVKHQNMMSIYQALYITNIPKNIMKSYQGQFCSIPTQQFLL